VEVEQQPYLYTEDLLYHFLILRQQHHR